MPPTRPRVMSHLSPKPPRFTAQPASKPASPPARIHVKNVMTRPPSSGYSSLASSLRHRRTRHAPSRLRLSGWTGAQPPAGRRSRRPVVVVLSHQKGREHFDRPLVEGPVIDHHLYGGTREAPHPLGRRGGADDDVCAPHQATKGGPFG